MKLDLEVISLFQTIIFGITALLTWYIYNKNKRDDLKSRAKMLYYQIRNIEENINYLRANCYKNNLILSAEFYKSTLIYSENLWENNKIFLAGKLKIDNYNEIEKFYVIATNLLNEQVVVKNAFSNLISTKQRVYYEQQLEMNIGTVMKNGENKIDSDISKNKTSLDKAMSFSVEDYIPVISNDIVRKNLCDYKPLTDGISYENVKKIAGIKK
jgi:hypothetical protein